MEMPFSAILGRGPQGPLVALKNQGCLCSLPRGQSIPISWVQLAMPVNEGLPDSLGRDPVSVQAILRSFSDDD